MCNYDIACLQETWLGSRDVFNITGLLSFSQDRQASLLVGGTAIFCRNSLDPSTLYPTMLSSLGLESSAVVVNGLSFHNKKLLIISSYRPPNIFLGRNGWTRFQVMVYLLITKWITDSLFLSSRMNTYRWTLYFLTLCIGMLVVFTWRILLISTCSIFEVLECLEWIVVGL